MNYGKGNTMKPTQTNIILTVPDSNRTLSGLVVPTTDKVKTIGVVEGIHPSDIGEIKQGSTVIFQPFSADIITYKEVEYYMVKVENIIAVVDE